MTTIRIRESDPWTEWRLTPGQAVALTAAKVVKIRPGPRVGLWLIRDRGLVGAARIGSAPDVIEVRVEPKTSVQRLFFLLGYAQKPRGWRQEEVDAGEWPDLLPAVAHAFARAAERALRQGVLLGYRTTEESLNVVRGRIREADQIRRRYGFPIPVEVRYDDYTVDIAENRLLLAAALRFLRLRRVPVTTRKLLRRLLVRLDGVGRIAPGPALPEWTPTRLNTRYHTALGLAELVLRGGSYELDDGSTVRVDGLVLEMWRVFEDFMTVALSEAMRSFGGRSTRQDTRHHLDHARKIKLRPDLVCYAAGGTPLAVVDAKYKIEESWGRHQADLYQMLAYCTAMGLRRGDLVYAAGPSVPYAHRVVGTEDLRIVETALDLSSPPQELLAQIARLAREIAGTEHQAATVSP